MCTDHTHNLMDLFYWAIRIAYFLCKSKNKNRYEIKEIMKCNYKN